MGKHPPPDTIADCVLHAFHALPKKYKPRIRPDGRGEWVVLAGIVVSRRRRLRGLGDEKKAGRDEDAVVRSRYGRGEQEEEKAGQELKCVALATGMKCLPHAKLPTASGRMLHDSHAEVLAIRGFNRWIVDECADLARRGFRQGREEEEQGGEGSAYVRWRREGGQRGGAMGGPAPFELEDGVEFHMYASEAPCGDASMELVMREQVDDTPWDRAPPPSSPSAPNSSITSAPSTPSPAPLPGADTVTNHAGADGSAQPSLLGRGHFSHLGIVRRKPSRPDAPATRSKSCSDKLALKQCLGLLSALPSLLVGPRGTWLSTLTLPEGQVVAEAVERCFVGRMEGVVRDEGVQGRWAGWGYGFRGVEVRGTGREFGFSRRRTSSSLVAGTGEGGEEKGAVPSNLCAVSIAPPELRLQPATAEETSSVGKREILINGILQGRRPGDAKGASCLSRRRTWEDVRDVLRLVDEAGRGRGSLEGGETYGGVKNCASLAGREMVKRDVRALALKGWRRNEGDEGWILDGTG